MKVTIDQLKSAASSHGSKPSSKDDLKSISMAELQVILASSPDGISQVEAQRRLSQYGPNEMSSACGRAT